LCERRDEWNCRDVAVMANAVAYFYLHSKSFWFHVSNALPKLVWDMNPLELSNLVAALARMDRRHPQTLLLIARMCQRCAINNLFSQETLTTTLNAFVKLDFNAPRLLKALEIAAVEKIDRALEMGPNYRASSLRGVDVFDVQGLVLLTNAFVCFVGTSDEIMEKLLTLISWSAREISDYQARVLRTMIIALQVQHEAFYERLDADVKEVLTRIQKTPAQVRVHEARWQREVLKILKKMDVYCELKSLVDDQVLDIYLTTSKVVVCTVGPYSFYANTTHRTARSKLHQRLLEMVGHKCIAVPYYEWAELRTEEDKMVYLWSMGRRAVAIQPGTETGAESATIDDEMLKDDDDSDDEEEMEIEIVGE